MRRQLTTAQRQEARIISHVLVWAYALIMFAIFGS
jgi:hypothetical protein